MSRLGRPAAALGLVLALLFGLLSASPTTLAQTETPEPTPSPTPSPPDLVLAARLAQEGKAEAAIAAYLAVIGQGTPQQRLAARLPLARVYLDAGRLGDAAQQLDALLLEAPAAADVRPAQFLLAEALSLQGDWDGALPLYTAYIGGGGGASDFARLGRAEALARVGHVGQATQEAKQALTAPLPDATRAAFILTMAQALESTLPSEALPWYLRLEQESTAPSDRATAIWRSALIERDLGNGDGPLIAAALTIIQQYPETAPALQAVKQLPALKGAGVPDPYYVGLVYYKHGDYQTARPLFEQVTSAQPGTANAARAWFYVGAIDEAGDTNAAIAAYGKAAATDPRMELADDALWWRSRLLEQAGRDAEASASYQQLVSQFGDSKFAPEARFRIALLDYDAGHYRDAAQSFATLAGRSSEEDWQRAMLWQGKAWQQAGDSKAAQQTWQQVVQKAPDAYYGLRAAVLLGDAQGRLRATRLTPQPEPDWNAIATWLTSATGHDPSLALDALLYDKRWGLGQELLALGMRRRAGEEADAMLKDAGRDVPALYQLARSFNDAGMTHLSSRAATRLLFALPDDVRKTAPAALWRLAYPAPFSAVVSDVASEEKVPAVLLLALVRQESFFDPLAGSSAGALGLTQVIPATGEAIAQDLAMPDFTVDELYRPVVSLTFGAHYLRQQLDLLNGNVYYALAAYNAGPGSAQRWRDASGGDVDRFLEEIDYSQTKAYLQLVLENLARYRQLYQGLQQPALPAD